MKVAFCSVIWDLWVPFRFRGCRLCHMSLGGCFLIHSQENLEFE